MAEPLLVLKNEAEHLDPVCFSFSEKGEVSNPACRKKREAGSAAELPSHQAGPAQGELHAPAKPCNH